MPQSFTPLKGTAAHRHGLNEKRAGFQKKNPTVDDCHTRRISYTRSLIGSWLYSEFRKDTIVTWLHLPPIMFLSPPTIWEARDQPEPGSFFPYSFWDGETLETRLVTRETVKSNEENFFTKGKSNSENFIDN